MTDNTTAPIPILFLEQQAHRAGAQRVLGEVLHAVEPDYLPIVGFPEDGPFLSEVKRRGIETFLYPLGRYSSGPKSAADMARLPVRSVYCAWLLARTIRRRGIRLIYVNGPRSLVAGVLAARLTRTPVVFHLHLTMTRKSDIFVVARAATHLSKIVACSETTAAVLLASHPEFRTNLQVIYNPVRLPCDAKPDSPPTGGRSADASRGKDFVVGVVGRITVPKGQHVVLDAALELVRRGQKARVIFVGAPGPHSAADDTYLKSLESFARNSGLDGQITWAGYHDDPNPLYRVCDVVVIPSTVSEGLPMVAIEAMQLGIPVIGSSVGGIPEVVRDGVNGYLFPPGNSAALTDRIQKLLNDRGLLAQMKVEARACVDGRFSTDNFTLAIRRVIRECLQGSSARPAKP